MDYSLDRIVDFFNISNVTNLRAFHTGHVVKICAVCTVFILQFALCKHS